MKKKKIWKGVAAVILAVTLILPIGMFGGKQGNVAKAETTNLVTNGDFDSDESTKDVTGWTPGEPEVEKEIVPTDIVVDTTSGWSEVSDSSDTGTITYSDEAVQLTMTTANNYTVRTGNISVVSGTAYTITYDIKVTDATSTNKKIRAMVYDTSVTGKLVYGDSQALDTDGEWRTMSFYSEGGTVTSGVSSWHLRFQLNVAATVYIKNLKVTYDVITGDKIEEIPAEVLNGDFESGITPWTSRTQNTIIEDSDRDGQVLRINDNGTGYSAAQSVTVKPNTDYKLSYYTKLEKTDETTGTPSTRLRLTQRKKEGTSFTVIGTASWQYNYEEAWTLKEYAFTTGDTVDNIEICLQAYTPTNGYGYFDDVTLVELAPVYGDGVTLNGDNYAMKLSNGNSATYAGDELATNLTEDIWYRYSYDVDTDENVTMAGFKIGDTIKTSKSGVFKYEADQAIGFAVEGSGVAYFDNLVITPLTVTMEANATYIMTLDKTEGEGTIEVSVGTATVTGLTTDVSKYLITPSAAGEYEVSFVTPDGITINEVSSDLNRGDFDFDGTLSDAEFHLMRKGLIGVTDTETDASMMDLTADGEATVLDLVRMKKYAVSLE